MDIELVDYKFTLRNGRLRLDGIGKILHIFYMGENILIGVNKYKTWTISTKIYDHVPPVLQFDSRKDKIKYPFKFNLVWNTK